MPASGNPDRDFFAEYIATRPGATRPGATGAGTRCRLRGRRRLRTRGDASVDFVLTPAAMRDEEFVAVWRGVDAVWRDRGAAVVTGPTAL
jgi:hypothetical protein